jgi:hypothetical protein
MVVGKTGITIAQVAFLGVGVTAAALLLPLPPPVLGAAAAALVLEIIVVTGFVLIQRDGAVRRVVSLLRRWSWHTVADRVQGLVALDDLARGVLSPTPGTVHGLDRSASARMGHRKRRGLSDPPVARIADLVADGAVHRRRRIAVSFLAFSVPARLGVLEGGYMAVFAALGLASGGGLSLALVRRLRLIVWSLLGVAVLLVHRATAARRADAIMARSAAVPGLVTVPRELTDVRRSFLLLVLRLSIARPWLTVALSIALAMISLAYARMALTFETSSVRLLPQNRVYVQRFQHYLQEFGDLNDIVIVVESPDIERSKDYAERLADELARPPLSVARVNYRIDPERFGGRALLYLSTDELADLRDGWPSTTSSSRSMPPGRRSLG